MEKNKNCIWLILSILLFLFSSFIYIDYKYNWENIIGGVERVDTFYQTRIDTLRFTDTFTLVKNKFIPLEVVKVKTDTVYDKEGNEIQLVTENKAFKDTLCNRNDSIILTNYISGVNVQLDSIRAEWRKQELTTTNTIEIVKYIKEKKSFWNRFTVSPQIGVGYGAFNRKFDTYIGVGIGYDFK